MKTWIRLIIFDLILNAIYVIFILVCIFIVRVHAENYCDDMQEWKKWHALAMKSPDDDATQMLHALRIGLCQKIRDGSISEEKAIILFDKAHQLVIRQAQANEDKRRKEVY